MAVAAHERSPQAGHAGAMKDPVCGMSVDPHTAKHRREHGGRTYYFCSARCAEKFEAEPETYLGPERAQAKPAPRDAIYTCPMHPEIEQVGAGRLPDLRDGARAEDGPPRGGRPERRISRHASAFLGQRHAVPAAADLGDGRASSGAGSRHPAADGALAPAGARDAGRALGRMADLQALLGIVPEAQPEHVDLDRDRRRRGVSVQRGRDDRARDLPGGLPWAPRARSTSTSRPRR